MERAQKVSLLISFIFLPAIKMHSTTPTFSYTEHSQLDALLPIFRIFKLGTIQGFASPRNVQRMYDLTRQRNAVQPYFTKDVEFPCALNGTRSEVRPTSVHRLRPGDFDVIGAIGDSLSAGCGALANSLLETSLEMRGMSFTAGGEGDWRRYLTLPNIIKVFNPQLIGYSTRPSLTIERASQFNVAEGGAVSHNMPYMTKILIKRILNDTRVNVQNDWKLITVTFGSNDMCTEVCYLKDPRQSLERHRADLLSVLRTLRDHLPRTFVNLIPAINPWALRETSERISCHVYQLIGCSCLFGEAHKHQLPELERIYNEWQQIDVDVANLDEFQTDTFTVVAQTLTINVTLPRTKEKHIDFSYFSVDCFHFSQKGYAILANLLWNNMLQQVDRKTNELDPVPLRTFLCPSQQQPFVYTKQNSFL